MAKSSSDSVAAAVITSKATILSCVISGLFGLVGLFLTQSATGKVHGDMSIVVDTLGPINQAKSTSGPIRQAGRDYYERLIIVGDTSKKKPNSLGSSKPTTIIDQSVKSYNAGPGSITAREVTLVTKEESEIPISDNLIFEGDSILKISPKAGKWERPFFAVLKKELEDDKLSIGFTSGMYDELISNTGDTLSAEISESSVTKNTPIIVYKRKFFTVVYFGDLSDPRKIYRRNLVRK